jgi:hypothetical protein
MAHKLSDLPQRMVGRHPRFRRQVRKQLALIHKRPAHPKPPPIRDKKLNQQTLAMARSFSANC